MAQDAILVTGAAGLIGNAVRVALEGQGRTVIAIDRVEATEEGRTLAVADVTDIHRLHALARTVRLAGIVHCAAYSGPMVARDNPFDIVNVNVLGTANLLEIARIQAVPRLVFCSTVTAYGSTPPGPVGEDVLLRPSNVYGASKAAAEQIVNAYASQHRVDGVSIRIGWVYGPRRRTSCAIRQMVTDALLGQPTKLAYGRDFRKQYVHVDDATGALIAALDAAKLPRRSYNATGGTFHTLGDIARIVARVLPAARIAVDPARDPDDDVQERFDISAAKRDLGWSPQIGLEEGIRQYAEWLKDHLPPRP